MFWILLLVVMFAVPRLLARRRRRRTGAAVGYRYRPMRLLVGSPGTGKSYYLTFQAVKSLAEGRNVVINFGLRPDRVYRALRRKYGLNHRAAMDALGRIVYFRSFDDLIDAKNADVYLDEVQDILNSRMWASIPWAVIQKLAQHRHFKLRMVLACHRFMSLDSYVREGLVAQVYVSRAAPMFKRLAIGMRTMIFGPQPPTLHYMQVKDESDELARDVKKRKGLLSRWSNSESIPLDPMIAECYDHIGGVFESPLQVINREKNKSTLLVVREPEPHPVSVAVDGLPSLDGEQVFELANKPHLRARALYDLWPHDERTSPRDLAA